MTRPSIGCFICGTPRSGSGVLAESLWRTRLASAPDQYLLERAIEQRSPEWGVTGFPAYLDALLEKTTTANGVFGLRLTARQIRLLAEQLRRCGMLDAHTDDWAPADYLAARLPTTRYVWLRRRDQVRQAVSLWRAIQSGIYRRRAGNDVQELPPLAFSFRAIEALRAQLAAHDQGWVKYFQTRDLSPPVLWYEDDIETDVPMTVRRILDYLGVDIPPDVTIGVHRKTLADAHSERLVRLFHEAAAAQRKSG